MSCGNEKKVCCEDLETVKADIIAAGFDPSYVADLVAKYGESVISLISDSIKSGFSRQFAVDTLVKFGPAVLRFLLSWFNKSQEKSVALGVTPGVLDANVLDAGLVEAFLERMLPRLLDKYGEQLLDAFIGMIVKYLSK